MQWFRMPSVATVVGRVALAARSTATGSATASSSMNAQNGRVRHLWWTCSRRSSGGPSSGATSNQQQQQIRFTPSGTQWKQMPVGKGGLLDKIAAFFASPTGKTGSFLLMSFVGTCLITLQLAPHSFAQDGMRALLQSHTKGGPTQVTAHMKSIIDEAAAAVAASGNISVFVMCTVEPQAWGRFDAAANKVLVGYPFFFNMRSEYDDADLGRMYVSGKRSADAASAGKLSYEKLKSEESKQLKQALLLSDDAKKFAICRELIRAQLGDHRVQSMLVLMSLAVTYVTCALANRRLGLAQAPLLRLANYAVVGLLSPALCVRALDSRRCQIEEECDRRACLLSKETAIGGVEFYDKVLLRQKALRALDDKNKKVFNQMGDFKKSLFRQKTLPITHRKNACITVLKEHYEANTQGAPN